MDISCLSFCDGSTRTRYVRDQGGGGEGLGETRLFLESVTKNVTKPQKLITENFVVTQTQETWSKNFTGWLPLRWLVLRQNETQRTYHGFLSLHCSVFLPLTPESVRAGDVWAYADVITKFSGIDRFPYSIAKRVSCVRVDAPL